MAALRVFRPALPSTRQHDVASRIIVRCWAQDPADRPSFAAVVVKLQSTLSALDPEGAARVPTLAYAAYQSPPTPARP